jgi:hypothetical protein
VRERDRRSDRTGEDDVIGLEHIPYADDRTIEGHVEAALTLLTVVLEDLDQMHLSDKAFWDFKAKLREDVEHLRSLLAVCRHWTGNE